METIYSGRPAIGSQVNVEGVGLCEVLSSADPSLVTLKRPGGATLKIGERALAQMLIETESQRDREHLYGAAGRDSATHNV